MPFVSIYYDGEDEHIISDSGFNEFPFVVQNRTMAGQFSAHVMTSIIAGFIISFPYVLYEFWKFISPGLLAKEKSKSKGFIFISSLLFFIGRKNLRAFYE